MIPMGFRAAAAWIAAGKPLGLNAEASRLAAILNRYPKRAPLLLRNRPQALRDAVEIIIARPDALQKIVLRYGYTDPKTVGGFLDQDL